MGETPDESRDFGGRGSSSQPIKRRESLVFLQNFQGAQHNTCCAEKCEAGDGEGDGPDGRVSTEAGSGVDSSARVIFGTSAPRAPVGCSKGRRGSGWTGRRMVKHGDGYLGKLLQLGAVYPPQRMNIVREAAVCKRAAAGWKFGEPGSFKVIDVAKSQPSLGVSFWPSR